MARASRQLVWLTASIASFTGVYPALAQDSHGYGASAVVSAEQPELAYLAENDAAMTRMMNDMAVEPTGDVDRDFVAMMTPHHQGAIDMAVAVLRYGHNQQLKRIAQEIIVDQQQEIAAMKLAIGDPLPPSTPAPTQIAPVTESSPPITPTPMPMSPAMPGMASPSKM